jgi:hypothetical protein
MSSILGRVTLVAAALFLLAAMYYSGSTNPADARPAAHRSTCFHKSVC